MAGITAELYVDLVLAKVFKRIGSPRSSESFVGITSVAQFHTVIFVLHVFQFKPVPSASLVPLDVHLCDTQRDCLQFTCFDNPLASFVSLVPSSQRIFYGSNCVCHSASLAWVQLAGFLGLIEGYLFVSLVATTVVGTRFVDACAMVSTWVPHAFINIQARSLVHVLHPSPAACAMESTWRVDALSMRTVSLLLVTLVDVVAGRVAPCQLVSLLTLLAVESPLRVHTDPVLTVGRVSLTLVDVDTGSHNGSRLVEDTLVVASSTGTFCDQDGRHRSGELVIGACWHR